MPKLNLLVVDDDPLVSQALSHILTAEGHTVSTAEGGEAGILLFQAALQRGDPFTVVITDLGMPYVSGRKVASAVKEASPATPVILLTGRDRELIEGENASLPHVDHVLGKPPKLRELREVLALCAQRLQA